MRRLTCSVLGLAAVAAVSSGALAQLSSPKAAGGAAPMQGLTPVAVPFDQLGVLQPISLNGQPYEARPSLRVQTVVYDNLQPGQIWNFGAFALPHVLEVCSFNPGPGDQSAAGPGPSITINSINFGVQIGPNQANTPFDVIITFWDTVTSGAEPYNTNQEVAQIVVGFGANAAGLYASGPINLAANPIVVTDTDGDNQFAVEFSFVVDGTTTLLANGNNSSGTFFQTNNVLPVGSSGNVVWLDLNAPLGVFSDPAEQQPGPAAGFVSNVFLELGSDITPTGGACCVGQTCSIVADQAACDAILGLYEGDATACIPQVTCIPPSFACCDPATGACSFLTVADCTAANGVVGPAGSDCVSVTCEQPAPVTGACCNAGVCTMETMADCGTAGGTYQGDGVLCSAPSANFTNFASTDAFPVAIADDGVSTTSSTITVAGGPTVADLYINVGLTHTAAGDLTVTVTDPSGNMITLFQTIGTPAGSSGNDVAGTYIFTDSATETLFTADRNTGGGAGAYKASSGGNQIELISSAFNGQPSTGVWTVTVFDDTAGQTGTIDSFSIDVFDGSASPCGGGDPTGACCKQDGSCEVLTQANCLAIVPTPNSWASGDTCPPMMACQQPAVGACCVGEACTVGVLAANCSGTWDAGNSCAITAGPPHSFCCPGNFDRNADKDLTDVFAGLSGYFAGVALAPAQQAVQAINWDGDGDVDLGDFFLFFADWFAACP